ncbi:MAG: DUF2306 domain-containing protein [Tumebacillaceae bacterium]
MRFKKFFLFLLFMVSFGWVMHNLSKNFGYDANFSKFLAHKTGEWNPTLWPVFVRIHIVLAVITLIAGPLGFVKKFRVRRAALHRTVGKIYIGAVTLNVLVALYLAFFATGGWLGTIGFLLLNAVWLYTTMMAYRMIRRKEVEEHRKWMVRSYSVTLANVTLNIMLNIMNNGVGLEYVTAYLIALWSCWLINMGVAEVLMKTLKMRRA